MMSTQDLSPIINIVQAQRARKARAQELATQAKIRAEEKTAAANAQMAREQRAINARKEAAALRAKERAEAMKNHAQLRRDLAAQNNELRKSLSKKTPKSAEEIALIKERIDKLKFDKDKSLITMEETIQEDPENLQNIPIINYINMNSSKSYYYSPPVDGFFDTTDTKKINLLSQNNKQLTMKDVRDTAEALYGKATPETIDKQIKAMQKIGLAK